MVVSPPVAPTAFRADLRAAREEAWNWISDPGTWLSGAERVDIVREVRNAAACALCRRRADALSPLSVAGTHDRVGALSDVQTEIVHRIVLDQGRLSENWFGDLTRAGVAEGEYVEIVAVVSMVMILDRLLWAVGLPADDVPAGRTGAPSRYRPPGARRSVAWVATVAPEDVVAGDGELYTHSTGNVVRALSLVPDAKRAYWALANCCYVPADQIFELATESRAISRPQIEYLASTVSVLHECFY